MPRLAGQQNEDNSENPEEVAFSWAISVPIEIEEDPRKENQYRNHNSEEAHRRVEWAKRRNEGNYPNSPNVYDSLGDAYLADGQNDLARQNAQKAIELLAHDSAEQKLKQLSQPR